MATNVTKDVNLPFLQAFDKLYHSIANAGYTITKADTQRGFIEFNTPFCWSDYGFRFQVQVSSSTPTSSQIRFCAEPKWPLDLGALLFGGGAKLKINKLMSNF